jgi:hypothetical protein
MVQATWANPNTAGSVSVYPPSAGLSSGVTANSFTDGVKITGSTAAGLVGTFVGPLALELKLDTTYSDITGACWQWLGIADHLR